MSFPSGLKPFGVPFQILMASGAEPRGYYEIADILARRGFFPRENTIRTGIRDNVQRGYLTPADRIRRRAGPTAQRYVLSPEGEAALDEAWDRAM